MEKMNLTGLTAKMCAAALFAAALSLTVPVAAQAQQAAQPATQNTPAPKILVIDRSAILRGSKVGQDIARQVKAYTKAAQKEFKGENDALEREGHALQQQVAILAPAVKKQKIAAFQKKQQAFQKKVQERQDEIQGGVMQARQVVEKALGPILQGIMAERGANLLMDRSAVVLGTVNIDVTGLAVDRLNKKLSTVKVDLVKPPKDQKQQGSQG
jgi:Skp family chaperone for outer membrane proteins